MNNDYKEWISQVAAQFRRCQVKAAVKVNTEMLKFYWLLGKDILTLSEKSVYGDKILQQISTDLQKSLPDVKSFSVTNLLYMKNFYLLYNQLVETTPQVGEQSEEVAISNTPQVGGQLAVLFEVPWGHHKLIIDKCKKQPDKALFYINKTVENSWSRAVLLNYLSKLIPEKYKSSLPSIEDIEKSANNEQ